MPVGGIIAWPKDSNPSTSSNIWLECNGQSFDTDRFPKLYKVLGSNKTPNYQGMFLRGAGSQTYSQVNGNMYNWDQNKLTLGAKTSTNHTSGAVGEIQGDGARKYFLGWQAGKMMSFYPEGERTKNYYKSIYEDDKVTWIYAQFGDASYFRTGLYPVQKYDVPYGNVLNPIKIKLPINPKHYKYRLTSSGGDNPSYSLIEYTSEGESDEYITLDFFASEPVADNADVLPMAGEFRPVNVAVKYYIRAK